MKRSQMHHHLKSSLKELWGYDLNLNDFDILQILDIVEAAGMCPPFSSEIFMQQKAKWGIELAHGNEWDPE